MGKILIGLLLGWVLVTCWVIAFKFDQNRDVVEQKSFEVVIRDTSGTAQCTVSILMHIEYVHGLSKDSMEAISNLAEIRIQESIRKLGKWKLSGEGIQKGWYISKIEKHRRPLILVEIIRRSKTIL